MTNYISKEYASFSKENGIIVPNTVTLRVVNDKIRFIHKGASLMSSWYKRSNDGTTYYTLSPKWQETYFIADNAEAATIKAYRDKLVETGVIEADDGIKAFGPGTPNLLIATTQARQVPTQLDSGQYYYAHGNHMCPDRLISHNFRKDKYLDVFNKTDEIINQVNNFLKSEQVYRSIDDKMIYKFGVLLYGPPGEGKTSLIRHLVNTNDAFKDAIIITITDDFPAISFLQTLNQSTKGRLKVFIFEEMTNFTQNAREIEKILTFLDGESSVDNSISFATTNYPELLPQNLVERPSRFDKLYKISSPNAEERAKLLSYFHGKEPSAEEIKLTDTYSSAFIKEICINARRNQITLTQSLQQVKDTFAIVKRDFKENKLGF